MRTARQDLGNNSLCVVANKPGKTRAIDRTAAEHGLPAEVHGTGVESYRVGADEREGTVGTRSPFSSRQVDAGHCGRLASIIIQQFGVT